MPEEKKNLSTRRDFLKTSGVAAGALIGGGLIGGLVGYNVNDNKSATTPKGTSPSDHTQHANAGFQFFKNNRDFEVLSNATERIFPKDDLGPGAIELGVPYFIDRQLAGQYGSNSKEYMHGPFAVGAPTQGYQSRLTRADVFKQGIEKLEEEANKRFDNGFSSLEPEQMDEILTAFSKDEVKMSGTTAAFFFRMLRSATLEGAYSDPMYSGNNNMDGWRMKGFPGHQMSYIAVIEKEEFQKIEPKSLGSM
ncbi:gluconate 2-dehydrogenase subunit 3 family protein [Psychrobacillus sp. NEAU-3TGS]|uniref:gluconate 2-dehydrogenase subunit 3 family protein n=1 Tax=Psychrobacillus sp. NEAU-3TGS TaxID=2995412 RepID=UPI002497E1B4|nr:gluconate 2-dehydrogenase subunit 3 family protein [Psychrobacillus sp. NEAU-3TGS]MDI2587543.1 gluconate 2-dehydrogenase subunit 3 family protein [Psychrobacillus sp. NEAU-3TGS]